MRRRVPIFCGPQAHSGPFLQPVSTAEFIHCSKRDQVQTRTNTHDNGGPHVSTGNLSPSVRSEENERGRATTGGRAAAKKDVELYLECLIK